MIPCQRDMFDLPENVAYLNCAYTAPLLKAAQQMGLSVAPAHVRAPHLIGVSKPGGFREDLPVLLAQDNVFVSVRGESIRISPHVYTTDEDIDRLFTVLEKVT